MVDTAAFKKELGTQYLMAILPNGYLSTRVPSIDHIIGHPGIPLSKLTIITGAESTGKTTLALQLVAQAQEQGGIAIYIDAEHKLDIDYSKALGVQWDDMVLVQPTYMEKSFKIMARSTIASTKFPGITNDAPVVIILDSMNAIPTKSELEDDDWESVNVAPGARVMSRLLRRLLDNIAQRPIALVFISQSRIAIGGSFSYTEDIACGKAPKFYSTLVIKLIRKQGSIISKTVDKVKKDIGSTIEAKTIKNQTSSPFRTCDFDIIWGRGVDWWKNTFDLATTLGVIKKEGAWFSMEWKGKTKRWGVRQFDWAEKNPEIAKYISDKVEKRIKNESNTHS